MVIFWICFVIAYIPFTLIFPTIVRGRKNLPKKQGYIVCVNHTSLVDAPLLDVKLGKRIRYLAKKELCKTKFSNWFFVNVLGSIPVDRGTADLKAVKKVLSELKNNKVVGIFPEGTRNKTENAEDIQELKSGAILFASKAGVPLVPVVYKKRPKLFCLNRVTVGEPFYVKGADPKRLTKEEIEENVQELAKRMDELKNDTKKEQK